MLEKWGLVAVLVSLRTTRPFVASAMKTSIESSERLDRNASQRPSGLSAGPTLSSALNSRPWTIGCRSTSSRPVASSTGTGALLNRGVPVFRQLIDAHAEDLFDRLVVGDGRAQDEEPPHHLIAEPAGDVGPERLAPAIRKVLGVVEILDRGQPLPARLRRAATSRCWDRAGRSRGYSAIPSTNHSGSRWRPLMPAGASVSVVMSNWNACTSSCPIT